VQSRKKELKEELDFARLKPCPSGLCGGLCTRKRVSFRVELTTKSWVEYEDRKGTRLRVPKSRIPPPHIFLSLGFRAEGGGVGIEFGGGDEICADGILVDVGAAGFEVIAVEDEVVGEASLPDGELRCDVAGESSLDEFIICEIVLAFG